MEPKSPCLTNEQAEIICGTLETECREKGELRKDLQAKGEWVH